MDTMRTQKENDIDSFAAFFGQILCGLKYHDLKLKHQPNVYDSYPRDSKVEMVYSR